MEKFITDNLKYPDVAKETGFVPRIVRVGVTVEPDGRIHSPRIFQLGIKEYDVSAQEVLVQMMQSGVKWVPGISNGRPVRSIATVAVHFSMEGRNNAFPAYSYDDDVYELVDKIPSLPTCQMPNKRDEWVRDCNVKSMQEFFTRNLVYPDQALRVGLEGDISVEFVVGKDGQVRNLRLMNDLGLGCGEEVLRLFNLMNERKIGWVPGEEKGEKVDVVMKATVPFRIGSNVSRTKVVIMEPRSLFATGKKGFDEYLDTYLKYPAAPGVAPCSFGVIEVKFKINRNGQVIVTEMIDYNNLGKDFQASVTSFLQETNGLWKVDYPNLDESLTEYYLLIPFTANAAVCPDVPKGYKETFYKVLEATILTEKKTTFEDGITFLDKAVRLFPADNKIRHLRGMALYTNGHSAEGCVDLFFVSKQNKDITVPESCKK